MATNEFVIEVLDDGRIKSTSTGTFDQQIHADADSFLKWLEDKAGGTRETKRTAKAGLNPHSHGKHQHHHRH